MKESGIDREARGKRKMIKGRRREDGKECENKSMRSVARDGKRNKRKRECSRESKGGNQ